MIRMMIRKISLFTTIVAAFLFLSLGPGFAQEKPSSPTDEKAPSNELSGTDIIKKSRDLIYEIQDQKNKVILTLVEKDGSKKKIEATRYWKNYRSQGGFDSKMLLLTDFPPDSRGVAFLIWDYSEENKTDDLWIYLPALRKVRRISAQDQNDAFLGSDLTFGDMGQRRLDEDEHKFLKEEVYQGMPSYVVESTPREKDSIYGKKVSWISKGDWTLLKIDYYDRNQKLLKRQVIDWQKLNDLHVWKKTEITNVQNSHKTIFEVSELKVNAGLQDADFTERTLTSGPKK